jgi:beta-lactamase class A
MRNLLICCIICLSLGFLAGFIAENRINPKQNTSPNTTPFNTSEFHSGGYKLINPLYECNTGQAFGQEQLIKIQNTVASYVNGLVQANSTVMASVYFRDLNNGPWFGVNEKESFAPSSLLKTPVMMAYHKLAQSQPEILGKKVKYTEDPPGLIPQNFPPKNPLIKGKTYTVEELIEHMISDSDNVALWYLMQNIDSNLIDKVTLDLQIPTANDSTPDNFMNVQQYATLFRVLYNSTYLNDIYSEKSLEILSKSNFNDGLVKLLPKNLTVAHKFGERDISNSVYQLHDCGVVYYPNRPYLICIMTKGPNFNDLETTIQQISKKVYDLYSQKYH